MIVASQIRRTKQMRSMPGEIGQMAAADAAQRKLIVNAERVLIDI
jgi:hypothetical protein